MNPQYTPKRRNVLKGLGIGLTSAVALAGSATGHTGSGMDQNGNGNTPVFATWGDGEIWEMLDAEPEDRTTDSEGSHKAHSPLYIIGSLANSGLDGAEHSPQFGGADQVVPVPGGPKTKQFSAQWMVYYVLESDSLDLATTDENGRYLTSASRIQSAENVTIFKGETIFTCPVRRHHGH